MVKVLGEICTTISPSTVLMRSLMMYHSPTLRFRIHRFWVICKHIPVPFSHSCSIISTSIAGSPSPNKCLTSDDARSPIDCADIIDNGKQQCRRHEHGDSCYPYLHLSPSSGTSHRRLWCTLEWRAL